MKNLLPMYLAFFCLSGALFGAADEYRPSMQRLMHLMTSGIQEYIKTDAPELYEGIQYFSGMSQGGRNFQAAQTFFFKAKNNSDVKLRTKACLFNAVILFLGGYGVERNPAGAEHFAKSIVKSESAADGDRIRACLLLDEIMHTPESGIKLQLSVLNEYTSVATRLPFCEKGLNDELCYRIARGLSYESRKECLRHAMMTLNAIFETERLPSSLVQDVENLRKKIMELQDQCKPKLGLRRSPATCEGLIASSSQPVVQAPAPIRFLGDLIPKNNYIESLSDDDPVEIQKPATVTSTALEQLSRAQRPRISASTLKLNRSDTPENDSSSSYADQDPFQERAIRLDRPLTPEDWKALRKAKHARDDAKTSKIKGNKKKKYRKK